MASRATTSYHAALERLTRLFGDFHKPTPYVEEHFLLSPQSATTPKVPEFFVLPLTAAEEGRLGRVGQAPRD